MMPKTNAQSVKLDHDVIIFIQLKYELDDMIEECGV